MDIKEVMLTNRKEVKHEMMQVARKRKAPVAMYFCIFLLFLNSMGFWIGWNGRQGFLNALLGLSIFLLMCVSHIPFAFTKKNLLSLIVVLVTHVVLLKSLSIGYLLGNTLPFSAIILQNEENRYKCLQHILRWFAYLMIPSIIVYILVETTGLPAFGELRVFPESEVHYQGAWYELRQNYLFYTPFDRSNDFERFLGPFIEPGQLGMILALLLFSTGFRMKNGITWINIVALLLTLSLAGYVLAFIGFIFTKYERNEMSLKSLFTLCFCIFSLYLFVSLYNGGDNVVNERIVSRLEPDEDKGFAGNNRVKGEIDLYLVTMVTDTDILLNGYDAGTVEHLELTGSVGTGIKMWMVKYGVIGVIMAMLFYVVNWYYCRNKRHATLALLFVFLMFFQRSYPFWFSWIICYTYGLSSIDHRDRIVY